jgi:hypothetical protein
MNQTAQQFNPPEQAVITVQHIMPAKTPGKSAWIKDTNGVMFGIWPDKLASVRQGESYEIEFTSKVSNGTTYRDIKHMRAAAQPGPAPAQFTSAQPTRSLSSAAVEQPRMVSPPPNYRQATPPRESEQMFVCNILGRFIQAGRVDCHRDHLAVAIEEIRAAYAATYGRDQ